MERVTFTEARKRAMTKSVMPGVTFASIVSRKKLIKQERTKKRAAKEQQVLNKPHNSGTKRTLSSESLVEPPSKVKTSVKNSVANPNKTEASLDATTSMDLSIDTPSTSGEAPTQVGTSASSEVAPAIAGSSVTVGTENTAVEVFSITTQSTVVNETISSELVSQQSSEDNLRNPVSEENGRNQKSTSNSDKKKNQKSANASTSRKFTVDVKPKSKTTADVKSSRPSTGTSAAQASTSKAIKPLARNSHVESSKKK